MFKRTCFFILLFTMVGVNDSYAHTGLKESTPKQDEVVTEEMREIKLYFETKIEQGSTLQLVNYVGEEIPIELSLVDNEMKGTLTSSLEDGSYRILWKIIGADGHQIEGEIPYSVAMPKEGEPGKDETKDVPSEKEKEEKVIKTDQEKLPLGVISAVIGVLFMILIGSFLWLRRKK